MDDGKGGCMHAWFLCGYEMIRTRQIGIVSYGIIRCSCFIATACLWLAELALALALGLDED
ncbi:hypothetical protein M430DRAFT_35718, partial [Amorphotheca resinae ATCC 22711]